MRTTKLTEFDELRPRLLALLQLHRTAETEQARAVLVEVFEDVFLAAAWHIAQDLLENGWRPGLIAPSSPRKDEPRLRVVGGLDAA